MRLTLDRTYKKPTYTIGKMFIDNIPFCDTLEDRVRTGEKVPAETAIPAGEYWVDITWSNRFNRRMPLIYVVPGFTGIRIHWGNTNLDTAGCPILGNNKIKGKLTDSLKTFDLFFSIISAEIIKNGPIRIMIIS